MSIVIYGKAVLDSTYQVTGFGGSAKRSIGARIMGGKMAANFENIRASAGK
jgi:hypothetical protein